MKQLISLLLVFASLSGVVAQNKKVKSIEMTPAGVRYTYTDNTTGVVGTGSGTGSAQFDVVNPANAAELNGAIASCTKPTLYVIGTGLDISETAVISGKSNLRIVANNLPVTLTSWNSGTQGIMLDLRGTIKNVSVQGFRFNCPLPSSSGNGDGGGFGIVSARGAVCPMLDGFVIDDCYFTTPNLHQNAIALVCVGWGGYGIRRNVTVKNSRGEDIKRMFLEVTNQEGPFNTNGTVRYSNIRLENCYARNLGNAGINKPGVATDGGMMASFDGPGDNNEVKSCIAINAWFTAYEAVGTSNVRFIDNIADYEAGYVAPFTGYGFTDGNHGTDFGPTNIKVSGGYVRCTGRGFNLTYAKNCHFNNVSFVSRDGNTFKHTQNHSFRNCSIVGISTNVSLLDFENSSGSTLSHCYAGNEQTNDSSGGRCTIVLRDGGCVNNRFLYLDHFQEKRVIQDLSEFFEATILNFSGGNTNQVLYNRSNNPSPGF